MSSIDPKFDVPNKFYKDFKSLEYAGIKKKSAKPKKSIVLGNASMLYDMLISIHKK